MWHSIALHESQLCLSSVLRPGQSFRWSILASEPPEYRLCLPDRVVCLKQDINTLFYRAVFPDPQPSPLQLSLRQAETLPFLNSYFQLDVDLQKLYAEWSARDKVFSAIETRFSGIRILRQDPWENLVSSICSSNNNIGRITKMVQNLCRHYSAPLLSMVDPWDPSIQVQYYPFPPVSVLAAPNVGPTLRTLGFGYRADFIQRTAKMLVDTHGSGQAPEKFLASLRNVSTDQAREELLKFVGVGRKVADCVLLMSLDKKEVIPVDTHVQQIAIKHYGLKGSLSSKATMTPKLYEEIRSRLFAVWGDYAGWAHSVRVNLLMPAARTYPVVGPINLKSILVTWSLTIARTQDRCHGFDPSTDTLSSQTQSSICRDPLR
ncbi:N-glycosylase/DNA lyase [Mycena belliarum]|uniref:DNA-(apurinic or apyrimidinic site) lyase n=1 Tax=Mycena belliarum TaxID=1033014 RepID=A0AAD6UEF3_9AGAR|nr:N-glycosylase/DNA lyase [Mycena belliae]